MEFERIALEQYFTAMCYEFEKDFMLDCLGGKIDFFFIKQNLGIVYLDGGGDSIAKAYTSPKIKKQLRKNGVELHVFTVSDVCRDSILEKVPVICDPNKVANSKQETHEIMVRFIKRIMREILREEPEFAWDTSPDEKEEEIAKADYDPNEEPISELNEDDEIAIIKEGVTENVENPEPNQVKETQEAHPQR